MSNTRTALEQRKNRLATEAVLSGEQKFTANIYGVETTLPRLDYRAGTFSQLQQRYADLVKKDQAWPSGELKMAGLLPALMEGGIHPNP